MSKKEIFSLNIETSTTLCSVSLGKNEHCIDYIEIDNGSYHSEKLHSFIAELLNRNTIDVKNLSVVAVSYGPGSYTGLRIGVAAAKTMAYALNIPLVTVSSLQIQTFGFLSEHAGSTYIVSTMAARNKKIYLGIYSKIGEEIIQPHPFMVDANSINQLNAQYSNPIFIGNGVKEIEVGIKYPEIKPSSQYMVKEVFKKYQNQQFSDIVYFEPMYI